MAMRELVTGGADCAVPGSSSSNPLGALADSIIGSSSKTQERLQEIPTSTAAPSDSRFYPDTNDHLSALPGSEFGNSLLQPHAQSQGSEFLSGFRSANQNGFADAWDEIQHQNQIPPHFDQFHGPRPPALPQPTLDGPPQRVLSSFLHSFVRSSHGGILFHPTSLPLLGLSEGDKQCIRDRSSIMARHFFADESEGFINSQVNALLSSLEIDNDARVKGPLPERFQELEDYWNESQGMVRPGDGWITEYSQHRAAHGDPDAWAHSFEQQHGAYGWASEFEKSQLASIDQMRGVNIPNFEAMEQTRMLAHTRAQNNDPIFQQQQQFQRSQMLLGANPISQLNAIGQNSNMQLNNHMVNKPSLPLQFLQQQHQQQPQQQAQMQRKMMMGLGTAGMGNMGNATSMGGARGIGGTGVSAPMSPISKMGNMGQNMHLSQASISNAISQHIRSGKLTPQQAALVAQKFEMRTGMIGGPQSSIAGMSGPRQQMLPDSAGISSMLGQNLNQANMSPSQRTTMGTMGPMGPPKLMQGINLYMDQQQQQIQLQQQMQEQQQLQQQIQLQQPQQLQQSQQQPHQLQQQQQ